MQKRKERLACCALFFLAIVCETRPAHAYLDPGTGSALVCVLVSVLAACAYMVKSVGYALIGRVRKIPEGVTATDAAGQGGSHEDIVLFSEGRDYWLTFKPVIEALLERGRAFRYLSTDVEDPALTIDNDLMDSRYVGKGAVAYGRVAAARARVMLSTTPNIGCPGYPLPKPQRVDCLAHVLHGCYDLGTYRKHSLDHYDAVLTLAPFMEKTIRHLEQLRHTPAKECFPAGTPNLDEICKNVQRNRPRNPKPVILLGPTWGESSLLRLYNLDFVEQLCRDGAYDVVLRPHPQSWRKEPAFLGDVVRRFEKYPTFRVDRELSPVAAMNTADILITERSALRFEFAFLYERPVITLSTPTKNMESYEWPDLEWIWEEEAEKRIGMVLGPDDLGDMPSVVQQALTIAPDDLAAYRDEHVYNVGRAGGAVADWLIRKAAETPIQAAASA